MDRVASAHKQTIHVDCPVNRSWPQIFHNSILRGPFPFLFPSAVVAALLRAFNGHTPTGRMNIFQAHFMANLI